MVVGYSIITLHDTLLKINRAVYCLDMYGKGLFQDAPSTKKGLDKPALIWVDRIALVQINTTRNIFHRPSQQNQFRVLTFYTSFRVWLPCRG